MSDAAVQTIWARVVAATLADAGVRTIVVSPGSRSTPIVAALAADGRFDLPAIIDERAAAFFALGVARATGMPAAIACTSGSAAAHYLPAIVEASCAGVPLVALTADRPPELQQCGASQTIDQLKLYGGFVRGAFELGAPVGSATALRALRRKVGQAVTLARGPHPGPVHVNLALRKPLEPVAATEPGDRALAALADELCGKSAAVAMPPRALADDAIIEALAQAIAAEPRGVVIAGAMSAGDRTRDAVLELCARAGYPLLAEAGSQLRFADRPASIAAIDHFDLVLGAPAFAGAPAPRLIVQLGSEPVAAAWPALRDGGATRWILAGDTFRDPDSSAHAVIVGDAGEACARIVAKLAARAVGTSFSDAWRTAERRVASAIDRALAAHPRSEGAVLRAALDAAPPRAIVQIGNSLPIRVVDQVCSGGTARRAITQRGAAGIDGLVASAAGATRAGAPVLLVLGDVSFAHDVGGLLAAREASAPLAIVVVDNGGGRIFEQLPIARANLGDAFARHFLTPPRLDPAAIAHALGARAVTAPSPAAVATAVAAALESPGATIIHAPCTATGAHDVRAHALALLASAAPRPVSEIGVTHA